MLKKYFKIAMYIFMIVYLICYFIMATNSVQKNGMLFFGTISLIIALYYEYLKNLYDAAVFQLEVCMNFSKANKIYTSLYKKDFLKNYQNSSKFFELKALLLKKDGNKIKEIIDNNEYFFNRSDELKLMKIYFVMYAINFGGHFDNFKVLYNEAANLLKNKKYKLLFDVNIFDGLYFTKLKQYDKAVFSFSKVNLNNISSIEKEIILSYLINFSKGKNKLIYQKEYNDLMSYIKEMNK